MAKIIIETEDKALAKAIAEILGNANTGGASATDTAEDEITVDMIVDLCKELGAKECRPILKEAGYSNPTALKKDKDVDEDTLAEIYEELIALQDEGEEEDEEDEGEEEDEEDEIDVETVKQAVQAFAKENGKEEADEILEEFEIKSVRSLKKLSQEQLEELYEAVTE